MTDTAARQGRAMGAWTAASTTAPRERTIPPSLLAGCDVVQRERPQPSPGMLTTYRRPAAPPKSLVGRFWQRQSFYRQDGSAHTVPVWFRWTDEALEVVIAKGDLQLRHLARDPRCVLVIFETVRPFRGLQVRGEAELVEGDVTAARAAIAGRYLGVADGERFAPNDDPGQGCCCGWSLTVRGCGICRASCLGPIARR
jgi:hypothetical protein